MRLIQTTATLENGKLILDEVPDGLPNSPQKVDTIVILKNEQEQEDLEVVRTEMQAAFKEAGIVTREQVMQLIKEVKQDIYRERYECKESF